MKNSGVYEDVCRNVIPVSYTHLDVYKRQVSWFLIMPYSVSGSVDVAGKAVDVSLSGIPLVLVGSKGIFVGIMCAFLSVHIYTYVERKGLSLIHI